MTSHIRLTANPMEDNMSDIIERAEAALAVDAKRFYPETHGLLGSLVPELVAEVRRLRIQVADLSAIAT
jgi:hypothetical protein